MRRITLICVLLYAAGLCHAGPLEELAPGHWYEVPNSKLSSIDPCPKHNCDYSGIEGIAAVIDDWNGGAFATRYGKQGGFVAWGGGHKGYLGNEVYVFDIASLTWKRVSEPVTQTDCDYEEGELRDGSPCSAHTYDYVDYHPGTNSFVSLGSASNHIQGGGGSPRVHLFSFDTGKWRRGARKPSFKTGTGASSAYDPNRDAFWLLSAYNANLAKYDPNADGGTGKWYEYQNYNIEIDAVSAIDPVRDLFVTVEGLGKHAVIAFDLAKPAAEPSIVTTTGDTAVQQYKGHGFEWDPVKKVFVAWMGGTDVYVLRPPEKQWRSQPWQWTKVPAAADNKVSPGQEHERGSYSRWRYVPALDVWMIVSGVDRNVFFYKLGQLDSETGASSRK